MQKITLDVPDEVLISLKKSPSEFSRDILLLSAIKLYQMGKLSSGRAAQLAGQSRVSFLQNLARFDVPIFDMTAEELKRDLENA